jgi:citrate lyase subunit beta/citryl-CoA lyase
MGTNDLAMALRVPLTPGRLGLLPSLSACILAARAHGIDIIDGVHGDLADATGFRNACQQGRTLGFDGKTLIHPGQIDVANEIFGVSAADVDHAADVIAAWNTASDQGQGIAVVNGEMIEKLHADEAKRLLALNAAIIGRQND